MARTVTLANLRLWARQLADVEGDPNITDAELTALCNRHLTEVYDALVDAGPPEYYAATTTVATVSGTILYALPADFRTLLEVYAHESATERRHVFPMDAGTRGRFIAPTAAWTLTLEYVPSAPTLAVAGDTFDGVSGWEELIANLVARDVMIKREADPSAVMASIAAQRDRIAMRARNRDRGHPRYTADTDTMAASMFPWGYANNVRIQAYRLRASNIELYESAMGWP